MSEFTETFEFQSPSELTAYAREVLAGRRVIRAELTRFLQAYLDQPKPVELSTEPCPVKIKVTQGNAIFLPPEANQLYSVREARALIAALTRAVESLL